jgi:polysaccharide pyruvyl transferase WcaK-like protein
MLDISGGDSFTDLYGPRRFREISGLKRATAEVGVPLILLPQTYGPFNDPLRRASASELVRYACQAWARDARSFEILRDLLGDTYDPSRHRLGVDVAFQLPVGDASRLLENLPESFAGINVSGLIWNNPAAARDRYGFKADYRLALQQIVAAIAREMPVVLVPHVLTPRGHYESDRNACEELLQMLPDAVRSSVHLPPDPADPCEAKGLIARCQWFLGTRMHATIAALSSGVPACAIAYSDKTLGVFETCHQGAHVHDPRKLDTDTLVERVIESFSGARSAKGSLEAQLPGVLRQAQHQMDHIAEEIRRNFEAIHR